MNHYKTICCLSTVSAVGLGFALVSTASAQERQFNLAPQGAASTLQAFAQQANVQILVPASNLPETPMVGLQGRYDVQVALNRLIENTGLGIVSNNGSTIVLAPVARGAQTQKVAFQANEMVAMAAAEPAARPASSATAAAEPRARSGVPDMLEEVIVTATRQEDTVNKVPLSITAVTQQNLDQQGVRDITDLARSVPALSVAQVIGGVQQITIRGVQSPQGAATTGVYLDDTPLAKRAPNGGATVAIAGTPAPPLFDLERIEVLRGPQGTLYGGSSEGGAIRYITPTPSLSNFSSYAKAEAMTVDQGSMGYSYGLALGGPIVQDKLGFRISAFRQYRGGYIDIVDAYNNGAPGAKDINDSDMSVMRGVLRWAPADNANVTLSYYMSSIKTGDSAGTGTLLQNPAIATQTVTTPQRCFDTTRQFGATPAPTTAVTCPTGAVPANIFVRNSRTFGPFPYLTDPNKTISNVASPAETKLKVAALTIDYDFGPVTLKAISSYLDDKTNSHRFSLGHLTRYIQSSLAPNANAFPLWDPNFYAFYNSDNDRNGFMQEVRFASRAGATPFSWVAGLYYSRIKNGARYHIDEDVNFISRSTFGISPQQLTGVNARADGSGSSGDQSLNDVEKAVFTEASYMITDRWKAIAGIRLSKISFDTHIELWAPFSSFEVPTKANGGIVDGAVTETPVTPKFGIQHQLSDNDMVYATVAKGFRAGGVNPYLSPLNCGPGLASVGLTSADIPSTYQGDSVWSYEGGAKLRLGDRVQLNSSLFRIDWTKVMATIRIPGCTGTYTQNVGQARSQGFDLEAQARLFDGMSMSLAYGYDDAKYTETAFGPTPLTGAPVPVVLKDQKMSVPPWTLNVGARYDMVIAGADAYLRADYTQTAAYSISDPVGLNAYTPDTLENPVTRRVNLRAGLTLKQWQASLFVNNLLNSDDFTLISGGRSGCSAATGAACTTFSNYTPFFSVATLRPREVGVTIEYRY